MDVNRTAEHSLGFRTAAQSPQEHSTLRRGRGDMRMRWTKGLFVDLHGSIQVRFTINRASEGVEDHA